MTPVVRPSVGPRCCVIAKWRHHKANNNSVACTRILTSPRGGGVRCAGAFSFVSDSELGSMIVSAGINIS